MAKRRPINAAEVGSETISVPRIAELTGLLPTTVYEAIREGALPAIRTPAVGVTFYTVLTEDAVAWSRCKMVPRVAPGERRTPTGDAELITVPEVVRRTGLSRQAVHHAIKEGRLAAVSTPSGKKTVRQVRPRDVSALWDLRAVS